MPDLNLGALASQFLSSINPAAVGSMQHWAIRKEAIAESLDAVRQARSEEKLPTATARRGTRYGSGSFMTRVGNTAIVPVMGPLVARMNWAYWSYDEIIRDLNLALADDSISSILLDIDSPGGMVANVEAAAEAIAAAAKQKPLSAHVGGIGASAAYWLAASAGNVTAAPTSIVGSVGCLIRYMDIEGIFTKLGARFVEVIASQSPNKRLDPDSEEGRAELQAIADRGAELFLTGLEEARGVDRATLLDRYGQGLVFTAQDALARGMIDQVASFEEIIADLAGREDQPNSAETAAAQLSQETIMAQKDTGQQPEKAATKPVTAEGLRAEHGDLISGIESAARDAGAKEERDRILGIEKNALPGHEAIVSEMKADGKTTPEQAAVRILQAEKEAGNGRADVLNRMDAAAEGVVSTPSQTGDQPTAKATTPDEWKSEWEKDSKLRAEFPTAEAYVATMKREAAPAA